jgi:hypothetical protein
VGCLGHIVTVERRREESRRGTHECAYATKPVETFSLKRSTSRLSHVIFDSAGYLMWGSLGGGGRLEIGHSCFGCNGRGDFQSPAGFHPAPQLIDRYYPRQDSSNRPVVIIRVSTGKGRFIWPTCFRLPPLYRRGSERDKAALAARG